MKRSGWWILGWMAMPSVGWAAQALQELSPALAGQWVGGLIVVLALILVCLWLLQRMSRWNAPAGRQIRLLGSLSLGSRERLVVVEVGQVQLIVGMAPGRVECLHVLEGETRLGQTDAKGSGGETTGFGRRLEHALKDPGRDK